MTSKKTTLIRICSILLMFTISLTVFCSCNFEIPEQPKANFKDIDVVITDIEKKQYFAGTAIREVTIEVYSQEYNLTKRFTETYKGMFEEIPYMKYEKGDTVKARLCTYYMESTGQIVNRFIDKVY